MTTEKGTYRAAVPSGASTGENEACELRDGGADYMGKGADFSRWWVSLSKGNQWLGKPVKKAFNFGGGAYLGRWLLLLLLLLLLLVECS